MFTVLNAVILRTLPVADPQQLFVAQKITAAGPQGRYSWPEFVQGRDEAGRQAERCAFTSPVGMQVRTDTSSEAAADRGLVQLVPAEPYRVMLTIREFLKMDV